MTWPQNPIASMNCCKPQGYFQHILIAPFCWLIGLGFQIFLRGGDLRVAVRNAHHPVGRQHLADIAIVQRFGKQKPVRRHDRLRHNRPGIDQKGPMPLVRVADNGSAPIGWPMPERAPTVWKFPGNAPMVRPTSGVHPLWSLAKASGSRSTALATMAFLSA